jgi:hypothetical protein
MAKAPNYTEDQTTLMVGMYTGVATESEARRDEVVQEIADMFKKNVRSVRAKLSREDVYVAKVPTSKDGTVVARKSELAETLAKVTNLPLTSADKLTKVDLKALIGFAEFMVAETED